MPQVRTDASKRYGLPEVPGNASDVKDGPRRQTYQRLRKLGTKAYDTREIIYYKKKVTQKELKEELRAYGYKIQHDDSPGTDALGVLEKETEEIITNGSNNDKQIIWDGEESRGAASTDEKPFSVEKKETTVSPGGYSLDPEIESNELEWKTESSSQTANLPTHEKMNVTSYATISKEDGWWKAVVLYNQYGQNRVAVYLWWKNDDGEWKRKQKYMIRSPDDWSQDRQAIEEAVMEL